ncbi:DUF4240 domain-containing protein [Emticicia agri]|uniref:DUF4240 domain-containing protein n=1 Tax=Emticicia agri TaxID=2492393 RepID=A0A4Q5LVG0_9BACT|nr:DUF4240 domain-containing protein [Emticicia agri]RYU93634.1 DUF4240 domain-containing protein [Emticicia agri]
MNRTFIFRGDGSDKFWRVSIEDTTLTVFFGKSGTLGRVESKTFPSGVEAEKEANRLIAEKLKKGYKEANTVIFGEEDFWNMIERARKNSEGEVDYQASVVSEMLSERPVAEMIEFGKILNRLLHASYRSDWWGAAYLINGGCSDDGFEYFRCWVILKGKKAYDEACENPESLAKYINEENIGECEAESLLYAASTAYNQKTGKSDFYDHIEKQPLPEIVFDWQEGDDSLAIKFPKLSKKCSALGF